MELRDTDRNVGKYREKNEHIVDFDLFKRFTDNLNNVEYHQHFPLSWSSSIINLHSQKQLPHCPHTDVHSAPLPDICEFHALTLACVRVVGFQ